MAIETKKLKIFAEIFPIEVSTLPTLTAYRLLASTTSTLTDSTVGGKLAYRLRRDLSGHWVWTANRLLTDKPADEDVVMKVIETLWREQPMVFKNLQGIKIEPNWQVLAQSQADFVARGLISDIEPEIRKLLNRQSRFLNSARVERVYDIRGLVVKDQPALAVSVSSRLVYNKDLSEYLTSLSLANKPKTGSPLNEANTEQPSTQLDKTQLSEEVLIGMWVGDKTSSLKGEIVRVVGPLSDHRTRLLALSSREEVIKLIMAAPDNQLVVSVLAGRTTYDYIASALRIIVRTEDYPRFKINSREALKAMKISPPDRTTIISGVAELVKKIGIKDSDDNKAAVRSGTAVVVKDAYRSSTFPDIFVSGSELGFTPRLRFGGNQVRSIDEKNLLLNLQQCGLFRRATRFGSNGSSVPIRLGYLEAIKLHSSPASGSGQVPIENFLGQLRNTLGGLGFKLRVLASEKIGGVSRSEIDILLAFFPDEYEDEDGDDWGGNSSYQNFKSLTVGAGIPSQVVYRSTLDKSYAVANIVLGILGKTGNVPFVLAEPLGYADLVVGIDVARRRKERLAGSINATAIARIYFDNGDFLRYVIHDAPLEGETVPDSVLQALFPASEFACKRVVVHRDGYFRGNEKQALKNWASQIGAEFYLVEIIKSGSPRLYGYEVTQSNGGQAHATTIVQPAKGTAMILSNTEALLVSTLPPFKDATPQPLRVRTEAPFTIQQALHSILSLTLLHYGSLRAPRLPVTIHYSDKIGYLALKGIKPKNLEGNIPFWL